MSDVISRRLLVLAAMAGWSASHFDDVRFLSNTRRLDGESLPEAVKKSVRGYRQKVPQTQADFDALARAEEKRKRRALRAQQANP